MTDVDFLEWRTRGIGASDIAGILNISPWASPFSVWASKTLGTRNGDSGGSEAMHWGKLLEDAIITETARRLGGEAYGFQTRCELTSFPLARATVDAFYRDSDGTEGVIEAKTTGEPYWHDVPEYYEAQVLWQLEVTGRAYGWVAALHNGRKLSLWRIDAQPDLQKRMVAAAERFWRTYVETGIPPAVDGNPGTGAALESLYREVEAGAIELDSYTSELERLREVRATQKTLGEEQNQLENTIKAALGTHETGTVNGRVAVTWKTQKTRRVSLDILRDKYPREAAECETITEFRRFIVKPLAKVADED